MANQSQFQIRKFRDLSRKLLTSAIQKDPDSFSSNDVDNKYLNLLGGDNNGDPCSDYQQLWVKFKLLVINAVGRSEIAAEGLRRFGGRVCRVLPEYDRRSERRFHRGGEVRVSAVLSKEDLKEIIKSRKLLVKRFV